jgi:hypothetical protein
MPRYVALVEHTLEAASPGEARASLEVRLAGLDQGPTAAEHGEVPARIS